MKTESAFKKIYDGFYCSICNAELHPYIDITAKTMYFSEKFCRDIIEQNLPTLLYQHRNFIKLTNLASQMLASCDFKGEFNIIGFPPKEVIMIENNKTIKMLNDAFIYRNDKSWFSYSKDVCQFFTPVKYPKLFDG